MDHKQIRCFVAAAEAESFSLASSELHLAPSALSRHISNLEGELGILLFERTRGGRVRLTTHGARLLPRAREVAYSLDRFAAQAKDEATGNYGSLTVAAVDWIGPVLLPSVAARVKRSNPEVHLHLSGGSWRNVRTMVLEGIAELAIVAAGTVNSELEVILKMHDDVVLVSPADDAPFGETCELRDVLRLPMIAPPSGSLERELVHALAQQHGVELNIAVEADLVLWPTLVRRGEGHTAIPASVAAHDLQTDGLTMSRIVDLPAEWSVVRRAHHGPSQVLDLVVAAIREEAALLGL